MSLHRLHKERTRFRILGTGHWEELSKKSPSVKSGELAPKMPVSPNKRSEVGGLTSDQRSENDG
jgi:hypothetical protein